MTNIRNVAPNSRIRVKPFPYERVWQAILPIRKENEMMTYILTDSFTGQQSEASFMDDFGELFQIDFIALAYFVNSTVD